jgi:hypothetical protein
MQRYHNDPMATEQAFLTGRDGRRYFRTGAAIVEFYAIFILFVW